MVSRAVFLECSIVGIQLEVEVLEFGPTTRVKITARPPQLANLLLLASSMPCCSTYS